MYDIITIGSATVDVFVKTKSSAREILKHESHQDVCLHLGSKVLIDEIHFDTGGSGTNCGVSFSRLGLKTGWLGVLGTDNNSRNVLDTVKAEEVDFLGVAKEGSAGYSVILVGLKHDRTILAYKGINDKLAEHDVSFSRLRTKWIYCGSMLCTSWNTLVKVVRYARKKGIKVAFNPSNYLASQGLAKLAPIVYGLDILVLNKEEAQGLLKMKKGKIPAMLKRLHKRVTIPVITDGRKGAYATDGKKMFTLKTHPVKVVDTTGAGDAFASGFVAAISRGKDIPTSLKFGQAQAESVLQALGAKQKLFTRKQAINELKRRPHKVTEAKL